MKKNFFALLLIIISFYAKAQSDNQIVIGTIDSINSKILGEQRKIWVYVPENGSFDIYAKKRYPVVYLLDGDAHFFSVTGMIQNLSGNSICPEMIVVGIPNTDRTRDLSPTNVLSSPYLDSAASATSGGGEKFMLFIEKELMPHIDSLYPTEPYRMLIGHSLGGLMVINSMVHHPNLFNSYICIDPSMWWDNKKLLGETKKYLPSKNYTSSTLFLAIANTLPDDMDTAKARVDTSFDTEHVRSILELNNFLSSDKQSGLKYKSKYYSDDDHGSVPLIAEYDAIHFIFSFYRFRLTANDRKMIDKRVIGKIEKHYEKASKSLGYKVKAPENTINTLGYQILGNKDYDNAEYLFKMNVANYPQSFNVYDSLGDLYDARSDKANAISNYKKALSLREFPETRQKLEKLEKK